MKNRYRLFSLFFIMGLISIFSGCDQIKNVFWPTAPVAAPTTKAKLQEAPTPVHGTVLAKINHEVITLEDFDEKIKAMQAASAENKSLTREEKKTLLNNLVTRDLIVQEAKARGIEKKKEVRDAVEEMRKNVLFAELVSDETKGVTVDAQEIENFYSQYPKEFSTPQEIRAREIVVSSESQAKEILIALLQGADFAVLAKEKSLGSSAANGGDIGVLDKNSKFDKFREVAASLDKGQISQIFKGSDGKYYIIKVDDKKGGGVLQLNDKIPGYDITVYDQVKSWLLQQRQAQRVQELTDRLKREAKLEIKEELL